MKTSLLVMTLVLLCGSAAAQWQMQESPTKESLRGLSAYSDQIVWASGTHGTYVVTRDGGKTWKGAQVPGAEALDFRDVEVFGDIVYLLAIGPGEKSRIYKTGDGGAHWELQFTNHEPKGFFDCMAFWDKDHGIAVGDPVNGKFQILTTTDGKTWNLNDGAGMPAAVEGEGAFAASGTCIAVQGKRNAWFVTGGKAARVFRSTDGGISWKVAGTPVQHGASSQGVFTVTFRDGKHGVIAGGDYQHPNDSGVNLAVSEDSGKTWAAAPAKGQRYFSGITYVDDSGFSLVAVGVSGSALLFNRLAQSSSFPEGFNAVTLDPVSQTVWAVGENGKIARFTLSLRIR